VAPAKPSQFYRLARGSLRELIDRFCTPPGEPLKKGQILNNTGGIGITLAATNYKYIKVPIDRDRQEFLGAVVLAASHETVVPTGVGPPDRRRPRGFDLRTLDLSMPDVDGLDVLPIWQLDSYLPESELRALP
jgi:hypothetical protein